jgi:choline dehydrogenase
VPWQAAFVEACEALGYPRCFDSNEPGKSGVGAHAMNKIDGRRISAAEGYLTPDVRRRPNLTIQPHTLVRRVLFAGRKVRGVEVETREGVQVIEGAQVVLCAGAINTPGILLRSGVGPRADVERLGCNPVADVPAVGRLLDHPGTAVFFLPRFRAPTHYRHPLIQTVLRYPSNGAHPSDMLLQPGSALPLPRFSVPLVSMMCSVGKPRGRGLLRWDSAHPRAQPHIDSRLLDDPHDRGLAVDAMLLASRIAQHKSVSQLATHFWPSARIFRKRADVEAWIVKACDSGYHPCGTVAMGTESDPEAAADAHGRVYRVEGLRVADASLMPTIPSSNIHLAVLMIGERIGAWLRDLGP